MENNQLVIAITSYNRPDDVNQILGCLEKQNDKNFKIYILNDGGNEQTKQAATSYATKLNLDYLETLTPSGLPKARNILLEKIGIQKNTYLAFLDDDLILDKDFTSIIKKYSNQFDGFTFRMIQKGSATTFDLTKSKFLQAIFSPFIGTFFPLIGMFFGGFYISTSKIKSTKHMVGACIIYNYSKNPDLRFDENLNQGNFVCEDTCFTYELYLKGNNLKYIPTYSYIHNATPTGGSRIDDKNQRFFWYWKHKLYLVKKFHKLCFPFAVAFNLCESFIYSLVFRKNLISSFNQSMK